ncbi:MAG: DUF1385 domain-containing protein [Clostridia bacterium]|nr:DUF1385 domain-containing protein [Clostridia bacterium]
MSKKTSIGGQALIEGILMRGPYKTTMAVRLPDKQIETIDLEAKSIKEKVKILKLPILRGVVNMVESLLLGYKALMLSADKSGFTDLEEEPKKDKQNDPKKTSVLMNVVMVVGTVLGLALSLFLFMWVPSFLFDLLSSAIKTDISNLKTVFEGIIKIAVFVLYIALVSNMKDIKRVFMYHGAEHKSIFCYEAEEELTVENIRKHSRFHPRCGTSFLIVTLIVSIVVSFVLITLFPQLKSPELRLVWVATKILIVPVMLGLSYELIKICGRFDNLFTRIISAPGLWLQRLTVKEPDDDMIEIAIAALNAVIPDDDSDRCC